MLYCFAKYQLNLAKLNMFTKYYVRNKWWKFGTKMFVRYADIVIFVLGHIRRLQSDVTELNWHGLVFDELTNGRAGRAHWLLVNAYMRVVT